MPDVRASAGNGLSPRRTRPARRPALMPVGLAGFGAIAGHATRWLGSPQKSRGSRPRRKRRQLTPTPEPPILGGGVRFTRQAHGLYRPWQQSRSAPRCAGSARADAGRQQKHEVTSFKILDLWQRAGSQSTLRPTPGFNLRRSFPMKCGRWLVPAVCHCASRCGRGFRILPAVRMAQCRCDAAGTEAQSISSSNSNCIAARCRPHRQQREVAVSRCGFPRHPIRGRFGHVARSVLSLPYHPRGSYAD